MSTTATSRRPRYDVEHDPASGTLRVRLSGTWTMKTGAGPGEELLPHVQSLPEGSRVVIEDAGIAQWDSLLVAAVRDHDPDRPGRGVSVDCPACPTGRGSWSTSRRRCRRG